MTVSYVANVSANDKWMFARILFRWVGSVWQLLWLDLIFFIGLYVAITLLYRLYLVDDAEHKANFDGFVQYVASLAGQVPLSFLLGFFVTAILGRFWQLCDTIPWMTGTSLLVHSFVVAAGTDEASHQTARMHRMRIFRYFNLAWLLQIGDLSGHLKRRFRFTDRSRQPLAFRTLVERINGDSVVQRTFGCLITAEEADKLEAVAREKQQKQPQGTALVYWPDYWIPLQWATDAMRDARRQGIIADAWQHVRLVDAANAFRSGLGTMWNFNNFNMPLVYTQVVVIAVYTYFLCEVFRRQFLVNSSDTGYSFDSYVPVLSIMQFVFYMGWFKIGMSLMNPLGDDKADLPLSDILDYNLQVCLDGDAISDRGTVRDAPVQGMAAGQPGLAMGSEQLPTYGFNGAPMVEAWRNKSADYNVESSKLYTPSTPAL